MQNNRWYWVQAANETGVPQHKLGEALLLFEHKARESNSPLNTLMIECLEEIGLPLHTITKIRHNYLKLVEHQSIFGGFSR